MIKSILSDTRYICIYYDEWTKFAINFIGITATTKDFVITLDIIAPDDYDRGRDTIKYLINSRLQWYEISDKISFSCTDCGSNVIALLNSNWFPCTNHVLNRCIDDILPELESVLKIADTLVKLRKSASLRHFLMLNGSPRTRIPKYTKTRWYSFADFFSAIKVMYPYISLYQDHRKRMHKNDLKKGIPFFSFETKFLIEDSEEIFSRLKHIMMDLESDNSEKIFWALSNVLTIFFDVAQLLKNKGYFEAASKLKEGILKRFIKYQKYDYLNILMAAAFLNPFLQWEELIIPDAELPDELTNLKGKMEDYLKRTIPEAFSSNQYTANTANANTFRRRPSISRRKK